MHRGLRPNMFWSVGHEVDVVTATVKATLSLDPGRLSLPAAHELMIKLGKKQALNRRSRKNDPTRTKLVVLYVRREPW